MDLLSSAATIRDSSSSSLLCRHVHHPNNYRLVLLLLPFLLGVVSLASARLGPSHFTAATLTLRLSLTVTRGVFVGGGGGAGGGGSASKCVKRCHSGEPAQEVAESLRYAHCHNIMIES